MNFLRYLCLKLTVGAFLEPLQAVEIKELSAVLLELTNTNPPVWSQEALQAFALTPSVINGKPVIDTPESATYMEARLITILYRLGLAAQQKGDK